VIYIFHVLISTVHRVLPALPLHNLLLVYKKLSYYAICEDSSKLAMCMLFGLPVWPLFICHQYNLNVVWNYKCGYQSPACGTVYISTPSPYPPPLSSTNNHSRKLYSTLTCCEPPRALNGEHTADTREKRTSLATVRDGRQ